MLTRQLTTLGLFLFSTASSVFGQSTYGAVIGTVKDSSGALVAGADVKLTNVDENTTRATKTNSKGDYEFLNTLPAHYTVSVTAAGFEAFNVTSLVLVAR